MGFGVKRMLLLITLVTSMAMTKEMGAESVFAHDPSYAVGSINGYSQILTGPFSPRVSTEGSCNANIVFNLLIDCVPFFLGTSSIPAVTCCTGVEVAVRTDVECFCAGLTDILAHSGLVFNVSMGLDLLKECYSPISYSIISNCVGPSPTPSPITPAPTLVSPPPPALIPPSPVGPTPSPITPAPTPGDADVVSPTFVTIDNRAVCLGGNKAAYYYVPGFGKGVENWVVYLPGGGWCKNVSDCEDYINTKGVGSPAKPMPFNAILSSNKENNPEFFDWNKVAIRYCDASSFTGNSEITTPSGTKLYFRGRVIFAAAMQELFQKGMGNAKNVGITILFCI
ncbi:unnamed protein product [Cuscuta epithymum]|uniref:Pectin acetylesterase n=1 Tax=Cuscuta epithymum TaxID=186058 RepID=A0AAV0FFL2_9ASTE|nr:unnamed protein product [Cuscuta epithymum]